MQPLKLTMENIGENTNLLFERNCVSGMLYITIDKKLICLENFKEHFKIEVIFNQINSKPMHEGADTCNVKRESVDTNNIIGDANKEDSIQNIDVDKDGDDEFNFQQKNQESTSSTSELNLESQVRSKRKVFRKRKAKHFETDNPCIKKKKLSKLESKDKPNSKKSFEMKIKLKSQRKSRMTSTTNLKRVVKNHEIKRPLRESKETGDNSGPKEQISCPHCVRTFSSRQKLSEHFHINGKGYQCCNCAKSFQLWAQYLVHQKIRHNNDIPISPEGIGISDASNKSPLSVLIDSKGTTYKCNICSIQIHSSNLTKHMWTHTNENVYQCCVCGTQTRYLVHLKNHLRVHSLFAEIASLDPSKNICSDLVFKEWTGKTERDVTNLIDNQLVEEKREAVDSSNKLTISCFYCLENFKGEQAFKNHCLVSTGGHHCETCSMNLEYHPDYLVHRKLVHDMEFPIFQTDGISRSFSVGVDYNGIQTFSCDICNIGIESTYNLNSHMRQHFCLHSYKCCVCKQKFSYFDSFTDHLATHSITKSNLSVIECSLCSKKFACKHDYITHHEVQSPTFICETCNVPHKNKAHLIVHTNIVHEKHIALSGQADANQSCNTVLTGQHVCSVEKYGEDVNSYKCNVCNFITEDLKMLKTHVMKHTGEFGYKCCVCGFEECDKSIFSDHLASHKTDEDKRTIKSHEKCMNCPYCLEIFKNKVDFDTHNKLDVDTYTCVICFKTFQYKAHLLTHCNIVHKTELPTHSSDGRFNGILCANETTQSGSIIYKCFICDKSFASSKSLRRHMLKHTDENIYKCCICDFKHIQRSNFRRHLVNHHKPNCFNCKQCGDYFRTRKELSKHQFTHKLHCELCGEIFENKPSRSYHIKVFHKNDSRLLKCDQCDKLYTTEKALEDHKKHHRFSKRVQCPECGKFVTRLDVHMKYHSKSFSFSCDKCQRTFRDKKSFDCHMLSHSQLKQYSCPQCHKKFPRSGALTRHLKIHLGEKSFVCEICGKACNVQGNLQIHMRVHNEKPKLFHCNSCELSFNLQKDLQEHVGFEHKKNIQVSPPEQQYFQAGVNYPISF